MKIKNVTIVWIFFFFTIVLLIGLRFKVVQEDESTSIEFLNVTSDNEFVDEEFNPVTSSLTIDDSTKFYPGDIFVVHRVKEQHHFYIFSKYYIKHPSGEKYVTYNSNDKTNGGDYVITADKYVKSAETIMTPKGKDIKLNSYSLSDKLLSVNDVKFDVNDYYNFDTLKFYIKRARLNPFLENVTSKKYDIYIVELDEYPVDSILYIRRKR